MFERVVSLGLIVLFLSGCAVIEDPVTNTKVWKGWGKVEYERHHPVIGTETIHGPDGTVTVREMQIATDIVKLNRDINTVEVLAEVAVVLGTVIPFLVAVF